MEIRSSDFLIPKDGKLIKPVDGVEGRKVGDVLAKPKDNLPEKDPKRPNPRLYKEI